MPGLAHLFTRCGVGARANPQVRPRLSSCLAPFKAEAVSTHCQLALPEMHSLSGSPRESSERKEGEPCHRPGASPEWDKIKRRYFKTQRRAGHIKFPAYCDYQVKQVNLSPSLNSIFIRCLLCTVFLLGDAETTNDVIRFTWSQSQADMQICYPKGLPWLANS